MTTCEGGMYLYFHLPLDLVKSRGMSGTLKYTARHFYCRHSFPSSLTLLCYKRKRKEESKSLCPRATRLHMVPRPFLFALTLKAFTPAADQLASIPPYAFLSTSALSPSCLSTSSSLLYHGRVLLTAGCDDLGSCCGNEKNRNEGGHREHNHASHTHTPPPPPKKSVRVGHVINGMLRQK